MIHLVFRHADIETLKKAIELDEFLTGDIVEIKDEFAVGPIANIDTGEGLAIRENWWRELLKNSPYSAAITGSFGDSETVTDIKNRLDSDEKEELWIWMGQNQHDVCGYYWLISQLKNYQGRVVILYMNNLPFINEKGQIFYPSTLHEIQPREFLKAKKLNRKVTLSEFEVDPDEWKRLCTENALIRILEGGKKIVSKEVGFCDDEIVKGLSAEWQKGNRAVSSVLGKMKVKTGDVFLLWRMTILASEDKIEINGDPSKGWKDFEVKLKIAAPVEVSSEQSDNL